VTQPFKLIEQAVKELIVTEYAPPSGAVGGDPSYAPGDDLFIWISLIPGGSTDQVYGEWNLDIDTFAPTYGDSMRHSLALEAILVGPKHQTSVMRIDNVYQNEGPAERPWDDESMVRIGATYVFTARRSG
jgi:hypothetical protein